MKGARDGGEVSDESPIITHKAKKLLDFSRLVVGSVHEQTLCVFLGSVEMPLREIMYPMYCISLWKRSISMVSELTKALEDGTQVAEVFLESTTQYDHVIYIDETLPPLETGDHKIHQPLESCWCIAQSKWHHAELVEAFCSAKSCLRSIRLRCLYLLVPT